MRLIDLFDTVLPLPGRMQSVRGQVQFQFLLFLHYDNYKSSMNPQYDTLSKLDGTCSTTETDSCTNPAAKSYIYRMQNS